MTTRQTRINIFLFTAPLLLLIFAARSFAGELIFAQFSDGQAAYGPSSHAPGGPVSAEVADDFNLSASVERIVATGYFDGLDYNFAGVYVRFYALGLDGKPGALQSSSFLAAGDPNVVEQLYPYGSVDVTLPTPFSATGQHFVSMQLVMTPAWYRWSSNTDAPQGQAFYFRDPGSGVPAWQHGDGFNLNSNADVDFQLYGTVTAAGHIDSLSAATLPRSGYLEIFGSNFGGSGQVQIDGLAAPVASWSDSRVVAYVPEAAGLTSVAVQVTNSSGQPSNSLPLSVTIRQADGRVQWRLRMDGPYARVRPVVAPDGTIYAIDVFGHLYALSPDGGLKWLVRGAGDKGVAVGTDGSVYVGSEYAIRAFHPDGSDKWTFVQDPRAFILIGVSVGPDGNVYAVGTGGMGVFSVTPDGSLRWQVPEAYRRPIVDYGEIVFGPSGGTQQLYFYANDHLRALELDGSSVFSIPGNHPAVGPDGSVHVVLGAYSPNGSLLWSFPSPYPYNVFTSPDVGSDGVHYFVQNLSQLFALNPDGLQRWHLTLNDYAGGPIVDPLNTQLVMGSAGTLDQAGFVLSASAIDGHELWRVVLPAENGFNQYVDTRARFTPDGQAAYIVTATATGDNATSRSFVYSLDAGVGSSPPPPAILGIAPPSGIAVGGGGMTIDGAGYVAGATVTIGGSPAAASVLDANTINATAPALSPGTLSAVTVTNPDASFATLSRAWLADFLDVPQSDGFHPFIEKIFRLGITAGCGSGLFCRDDSVSRAQMAVFLLKAEHGLGYAPPACTGVFADVACLPTPAFAADWIEQLAAEGITTGCGGGKFCPAAPVTREQMAVFLLKSEHGFAYVPPSCIGVFGDVLCSNPFADWIEQLAAEGVTAGCGNGNYCPGNPSTRGQMAVFLVKTFNLP